MPVVVEDEELIGSGILGVAAVQDVGELVGTVDQVDAELDPEDVRADRTQRVRPTRLGRRRPSHTCSPQKSVKSRARRIAVVTCGAPVVDRGEVLGRSARRVHDLFTGLEPRRWRLRGREHLVLDVHHAVVADGDRQRPRQVLRREPEDRPVVVDRVRRRGGGDRCAVAGGIDRHPGAVGRAAVVDGGVALRLGLRRVDR